MAEFEAAAEHLAKKQGQEVKKRKSETAQLDGR
jgi:hypothetical protein